MAAIAVFSRNKLFSGNLHRSRVHDQESSTNKSSSTPSFFLPWLSLPVLRLPCSLVFAGIEYQESRRASNESSRDSVLDSLFSQESRIDCQLTFRGYCTCMYVKYSTCNNQGGLIRFLNVYL